MAGLRLGPLLRFVDHSSGTTATVWVETQRPCTVTVRCEDGASGSAPTFAVTGHHYALVVVSGLTPGTTTPYEVLIGDDRVWPPADSPFPPSTITTPVPAEEGSRDPLRVAFGSCRWAAPPGGGGPFTPGSPLRPPGDDPVGPDALDALAARLAADPDAVRPDVLLLIGDQIYADETSEATRQLIAERRDPREAPGAEVADYEEYTHLYDESWQDPEVRWLLSTVPSCMIFDDHDVIDDWNTSESWQTDMRATSWWHERIVSGLMSYWVYQHLGNLSPAELEADPLYARIRSVPDGTEVLRRFAATADADPAGVRWSYRRDFGRVRVLVVDSRAARVLGEQERAMLDPGEARWVREAVLDAPGSYDHLLIGTSLPWLLPPLVHDAEAWDAALCRGVRGGPDGRWARFGEWLRRAADLEHWAAFPDSFRELTELVREAGDGPDAPATVCVLSGDVHHAYVAEPRWAGGDPRARVFQLTCSPVHNSVPTLMRVGFRFGWSRAGKVLGALLARHGRSAESPVRWRKTGGPWFGNQLMTLTLRGRNARLDLVQARRAPDAPGGVRLETVMERSLSEE
ncbi:alkaline phosphatase D family protein [Streptomyces sp. AM 2-1-1]|uniref:alkaline phosphatase D family protein n=1 Tax=Streptomyces sp. AM 2-1-1 TaxID=3028709 RepID=UPI0023B9F9DC|nr:alkaline phosphatase D family protein [Streptomyces sp. AM 2-1-1]WEH42077.1 alkaline phosphatase D family protein [Streptomyces sp. AM 2-1-1]